MGTAIGRLKKGELLIKGEVNERLPVVTNGLIAHFPFDGVLNHYRSLSNIKVLAQHFSAKPTYDWLVSQGAVMVDITLEAFNNIDVRSNLNYDLILIDRHVWTIDATTMLKAKEFCDAGISVITIGNDTRTNIFVKSYNTTAHKAHDIIISQNTPVDVDKYVETGGSGDLYGGIVELQNGAIPFYYRSDTNEITGFLYHSPSGAVLYHDQEGIYPKDHSKAGIQYALDRSMGNIANNHTTLTNEGIAVEENTANLVGNPDGKIVTNYNYDAGWDSALHEDAISVSHWSSGYNGGVPSPEIGYHAQWILGGIDGVNDPCMFFRDENNRFGLGHRWLGIARGLGTPASLGWNIGTQITISWWQKVNVGGKGACVGIHHYRIAQGSMGFEGCIQTKTSNIIGEWERKSFTYTITDNWDLTKSCSIYVYGNHGAYGCLWVDNVQVETKKFATSFVNGSRAQGLVEMPFYMAPPLSMNVEFTPTCPNNYNVINTVLGADENALDLLIWKRATEDYYRVRTSGRDTAFANTEIIQNNRAKICITCDGTATRVYLNGVLKNTFTVSFTIDTLIALGKCETSLNTGNNIFHSLSLYSRALSDMEVKKLHNSTFHLTKEGNVMNPEIVEKPHGLPSDALYFPLSCEGKDQYQYITPSEETNVVYEDGAVWVGNATTNLWSGSTFSWTSGTGVFTRDISFPKLFHDLEVIKIKSTDGNAFSAIPWTTDTVIETPGIQYTHSVYAYLEEGTYVGIGQHWNPWDLAASHKHYIPKHKWTRIDVTITTNHPTNTRVALEYCTDGTAYFTAPQYEKRSHRTPFVNGSRGRSALEFNLHDSIDLDWNGDWSIMYWKKPVATHLDNLTGYNIESIGCNSNSVGGHYRWWGKDNGSNTIYREDGFSFHPNEYFNKWHMVSMVKSGARITWSYYSISGQVITHSETLSTPIPSNAYVTQYGYDLKLGGWDDQKVCNTYFRDLVVTKYALTGTQLASIYNTQMRAYKDKLQIQDSISENMGLGLNKNVSVGGFSALTTYDIPVTFRESAGKLQYSSDGQQWNNV